MLLEGYLRTASSETSPEKKRLIAVEAALQIALAAAGSPSSVTSSARIADCLIGASREISNLADAIQDAIRVK